MEADGEALEMMDIGTILKELTAEEKASLVAGVDFMYTQAVPRLGIPALRMSDGPHGLRVQAEAGDNGVTGSLPATAFPTAATTACGWNGELLYRMGEAIAKEAKKYGVHVILGPGANIKRNPLAGRNFEYFSEDPLLAGKLAAAEVKGIQSEGVGACVKHFALNNAENYRFMGDSVADLRAMREIYLKVFEIIVKEGKPVSMMCAYNKINGSYCSQNSWLLTDVLRKEWGFDGLVMTDWGAMHDRIKALQAGLDLEMPGETAICRKWILEGLADGTLAPEVLDKAVENVLRLVEKTASTVPVNSDFEAHDRLAEEIAEDCAVLLKNDGVLPLNPRQKVFVCGDLFEKMRYQGAGSSMITPTRITSPRAAFDEMQIPYIYSRGYAENQTEVQPEWVNEAVRRGKDCDIVLVFAGLTDYVESEGCDRPDMRLPQNQLVLIDSMVQTGKKVVVILFGGSPVELPFADQVSAVLNMMLPGQSGGKACAKLLYGEADPAGRLAETWPLTYEDVPFGRAFSKTAIEVYKESVFVGYRYYLTAEKAVRYPFGYGLSYTDFVWSDMRVSREENRIRVTCTVCNAGERAGSEVLQLYVKAPRGGLFKPERELRAFAKIYLKPGESREVTLLLKEADLRCFDPEVKDWVLEGGDYELMLCSDCQTIRLQETIRLEGKEVFADPSVCQVYGGARLDQVSDQLFEKMSGQKIPSLPSPKPITLESRFSDLQQTFFGKILFRAVLNMAEKQLKEARKLPEGPERENRIKGALFLKRILESNSLISMSMSAGKSFPYHLAQGFAAMANGRLIRGIRYFCSPVKVPGKIKKGKHK